MTTMKLAKLYEHLTPRERLPLLIAAGRRGDEAERERLVRSAPRVGYRLPDYHGLADSMQTALLLHLVERLDLGARFWLLSGLLELVTVDDLPDGEGRADRIEAAVSTIARRFCVEVDGWAVFCGALNIDPDALLADLPAFQTVSQMERTARVLANTPEEAAAYLRERGASDSARLPTAEEVADLYRELLSMGERRWP
jgi:hypothetical protein